MSASRKLRRKGISKRASPLKDMRSELAKLHELGSVVSGAGEAVGNVSDEVAVLRDLVEALVEDYNTLSEELDIQRQVNLRLHQHYHPDQDVQVLVDLEMKLRAEVKASLTKE